MMMMMMIFLPIDPVVITYVVSTGVKENRKSNYEKRLVSRLHIPL